VLRILYAGSPEPSAVTLRMLLKDKKLVSADCHVVAVLTNPASAQGRHKTLVPTPVSTAACEAGIPVFTPEHLDTAFRTQIVPLQVDLLVCFAYGHIFGPKFLAMFRKGAVNLHPSLLPKYRGATPVPAAILNRDRETGISIQKIGLEMDAGDLLVQKKILLDGTETSGTLLERCAREGSVLLSDILCRTAEKGILPDAVSQAGEPSYTKMITKEDGRIKWNRSAPEIDALVRAYTPEPGCWTLYGNLVLRILSAHIVSDMDFDAVPGTVADYDTGEGILVKTGNGILAVNRLQLQAKKAMKCNDFMNGCRNFIGTVLD
jgi:methionyl-tRNA formyltransferase